MFMSRAHSNALTAIVGVSVNDRRPNTFVKILWSMSELIDFNVIFIIQYARKYGVHACDMACASYESFAN